MIVMGRVGYACAQTKLDEAGIAAPLAARFRNCRRENFMLSYRRTSSPVPEHRDSAVLRFSVAGNF
jgi:hypothetical protein